MFRLFRTNAAGAAPVEAPAPAPDADLRDLARRTVARDLVECHTLLASGEETVRARLMDMSPYGCQVRAAGPIRERGEVVEVLLPHAGLVTAQVMWGIKGVFGCRFDAPIDSDLYARLLEVMRLGREDWVEAWLETARG